MAPVFMENAVGLPPSSKITRGYGKSTISQPFEAPSNLSVTAPFTAP